jgi:lysophospholipase L1-like esterase
MHRLMRTFSDSTKAQESVDAVMLKPLRSSFFAFVALTMLNVQSAESAPTFQLVVGDRVVLLGDTFIERAQRYGWLETAIQLRFPKENIQFRNLGWSGDTVFADSRGIFDPPAKGYARMLDQVRGLKPTVIMLNYGGNEAFNGPSYIDTFIKQYGQLIDDLSSTKARIVLVSPLPLFNAGPPLPTPGKHNAIRKQFVTAVQQLAENRSLHFVDVWSPVEQKLEQFSSKRITEEGVHLTNFGYGVVSTIFAQALAGDSTSTAPTTDFGPSVAMLDAEELRQTIVKKNEMYFRRWRPQNVTYLFLFRKHEQGNNAKEVDEFLPIISRLEEKIFELKAKPQKVSAKISE